ncbi:MULTISPECIES: ABC transporter ATP-binding protein [Pseudomonas]|uniref:ABC transporter ATP-binding protein n=1 Tax=Pseudomonas cichorii TaxID=36746 RepID=A0A3M4VVY2_PSECI|nr:MULTISPECIES: ABC transporter ATP-binding protein [Pseudomonas]AHF67976.1 iron-chelate ABC transporter, FeCT family, ATP-binding protein [Pseudomonas cichorii JBC1]QVE15040.1 ABC transporter ATP-binding protein [Pseudomonas cichorii]RMR56010.1 Iron-chelate ABC transporter, FeCT family, ATP-binding protein [Pseudomonas cichorii]SDO65228.1 iron complex transport system ATP-binding protein [Pseudomonas cichorii]GFM75247.1 ABC transporter ATP-binding protein [Pseudomonas cichorii]
MSTLNINRLNWTAPQGQGQHWQLEGIDLHIGQGEFVGLIGPNGSGKTSLLRCAYRFNEPDSGSLHLDGQDIWQQTPRWSAQRMAVMMQEFPQEFGLTVQDVVAMGRTPHQGWFDGESAEDLALIDKTLNQVGLQGLSEHSFVSLSGGEKQRALLARALVQQPGLLILDEPTNHLDPRYQLELLHSLRRLKLSTLASFHDLNLAAAFCDRLYVIEHGQIVASGTPTEVLTEQRLLHVFGVHALVDTHPLAPHPRITWISPS